MITAPIENFRLRTNNYKLIFFANNIVMNSGNFAERLAIFKNVNFL